MKETNKKAIIYALLREINEGNKTFKADDFDISESVFSDTVKAMIKALVEDVICNDDVYDKSNIDFSSAYITLEGMNFLEENSRWRKTYNGLKEFKSWIPMMGD